MGLRVHLLGGLEVEGVPALALGSRKGRSVLRRLALAAGGTVAAVELHEVAWPEGAPARAADQLPVLISRLRSALGADRVVRRDGGYALVVDWLDLAEVTAAPVTVAAALAAGAAGQAFADGRAALQLARGPLLPEEGDAPWLDDARAALDRSLARLRAVTAEAALAAGAHAAAAELAGGVLDDDPYDEAALRVLLTALAAGGRVSSALAAYDATAQRLADDLGVDPSPETRAVHLDLLRRTTEPAVPAPAAGRQAVVAELLAGLRAPLPALVVLSGAAGMGKSTVLDALATAGQDQALVLLARGDALGDLPLQPVLDALAGPVASRPDLLTGDAALLAPLLAPEGGRSTSTAAHALTSGSDRAALATAVQALLAGLAAGRPVLLLVDDAHLLDAASVALLHHLTRPSSRSRLLVVAAARPGVGPGWRAAATHELAPLTLEEAADVVGGPRSEELWGRSGGHPLFLVELARCEGELPESVLAAVAARCTPSDDLAGVLRAAAVLGGTVDVDLLAAALALPVGEVLDHLDAAVGQQLLRPTATGYAFRHDLHREALASLVTPARATVLHRTAAQVLAGRTGVDPTRLGHHALAGGDDDLAAAALAAAAEVAAARYEHEQALGLLDRAVGLAPTPARRLQRARALVLTGRYDEADEEAQEAGGPAAAALEVRALAAYLRRDLEDALALASAAAGAATDPELAAGCLALSGRILLGQGELGPAEAALQEAMALSTGQVRGIAAVWLSLTLAARGDAAQAYRVVSSPATREVRSLPLVEPHRGMAVGRALAMLGRPAEALVAFDRLARTVQEQHVHRFAGRAENFRGWVLRSLGALEEGEESNLAAWEAVQALDPLAGAEARGHAVLDLADAALRRGDPGAAATWLDRAAPSDLAPHVMHWRFALRRDLVQGRLALAVGDLDAAQEHAAAALTGSDAYGVPRFGVQAVLLRDRARHRAGDPVGLDALAGAARSLADVAPLESWWLLAELARELDAPVLAGLARERVDALLPQAGPWADRLRAAAAQALD